MDGISKEPENHAPQCQMHAQRSHEEKKPKDSNIFLHKKAKMKIPDTGNLIKNNN